MIKAIDAAQACPPPEPPGAALSAAVEPVESSCPVDVPLLTPEEKRRILARIARVNPLDCFDETGAFDIVCAKRILPPGMVRQISVQETTRLNAEGQPVIQRRIHVRLVDPVSALRLDDLLERRRERSTSSSYSPSEPDSDSPPPHPASPEYAHNLLRQKTKGLDEARHTLAQLRKALAEKEDRKRQFPKELDEKDRQLESARGDTGCQPVEPKSPNQSETLSSSNVPSKAPSEVEGPAPANTKGSTPAELAEHKARCLAYEREEARNSMDQFAFAEWLRKNRPAEWAQMQSEALSLKHQKTAASQPARPPPVLSKNV